MRPPLFILFLFLVYQYSSAQSETVTLSYVNSFWGKYNQKTKEGKWHKALELAILIDSLSAELGNMEYSAYAKIGQADCYLRLENWNQMQQALERANKQIIDLVPSDMKTDLNINRDYYYGRYYLEMRILESALYCFEQIIYKDRAGVYIDPVIKKDTYQSQGLILRRLGDYDKSIDYYRYALNLVYPSKKTEVSLLYQNIGRAFFKKEKFQDARKSYLKAYELVKKIPLATSRDSSNISILYLNLAEYYTEQMQIDSANFFLELALQTNVKSSGKIKYYQRKGALCLKTEDLRCAQANFQMAYQLSLATFSEKHPETVRILLAIGEIYQQQNRHLKALDYFEYALQAVSTNFEEIEREQNSRQIIHRRLGLQILQAQAISTSAIGHWQEALNQYSLMSNLIDTIRLKDIISDESLFFLIAQSKYIYEQGIKTALKLNQLHKAFAFNQKGKSMQLLQGLQNEIAYKIGGVPDSLWQLEKNLKLKQHLLQSNNYINESNLPFDKIQEEIFEIQMEQQFLIDYLDDNYPDYHASRYDLPNASVSDIQKSALDKKTALIEYFIGKEVIYIFVVTVDNIKVITETKESSFSSNIETFYRLVTYPNHHYQLFCNTSGELYNRLLKKALSFCNRSVNQLIIIPDEALNYVPFGALIKELTSSEQCNNYLDLPYLILNYTFSYNYSSTLLIQQENYPLKNKNSFIGFAPTFRGNASISRNLDSLPYSREEVVLIDSIVKGKVYLDKSADLSTFKEEVPNYRIAHLATHATCNDTNPFNSSIHFYQDSLPLYEIYNLGLMLDLIVLSACETGTGKLRKGEGVQSLARAFLQSGCQSIITSLWTVNDEKTPKIMETFYEQLYTGKTKNIALCTAQRRYLKTAISPSFAQPFYWATFIQVGSIKPVYSQRCNPLILLVVLFSVSFLGWLILIIRNKNKEA